MQLKKYEVTYNIGTAIHLRRVIVSATSSLTARDVARGKIEQSVPSGQKLRITGAREVR